MSIVFRNASRPMRPFGWRGVASDKLASLADLTRSHPDDRSLGVPFRYRVAPVDYGRIAVVCHLYYPEMAPEFAKLFRNIPGRQNLYISTDSEAKRQTILAAFADWDRGSVDVRVVPNRGRDVAPKLVAFADVYHEHDIVLCLHSKASTHHGDLKHWRDHLLHHLVGSPEIVTDIFELFRLAPQVGMVSAQHHEPTRKWLGWSFNYGIARDVAQHMGLELKQEHLLDFPAGSMFWARCEALRPVLDLKLSFSDFPPEDGQKDVTLAHGIERLFYYSVECAGFTWVKIADPDYFSERAGILQIDSEASLKLILGANRPVLTEKYPASETSAGNEPTPITMEERKAVFRDRLKGELAEFLRSGRRIALPTTSDRPKVSILLVTWNQAELTYACLRGLQHNLTVTFEVVLVDNASSDETAELLQRVDGIRLAKNAENVGFLLAVNQAAGFAAGEHVLLLNNDAIVRPGALEAAVETLESAADIGAVGGPIVLLDGTLQEAGSIVWQDGACLGYGRGRDPNEAEFQFRRDVDYCSGAFLLVRGTVWQTLKGFDTAYVPAYYEESDLCMRLHEAGYRVVYEPRAAIDHYEFGSAVRTEVALNLQQTNHQRFRTRHKDAIADRYPNDPALALFGRALDRGSGRVLMVEDRIPHRSYGSGYPRAETILHTLHQHGYFVSFYPAVFPDEDWESVYRSLPREVEVLVGKGLASLQAFLADRQGYYDAIFVSRPHNMAPIHELLERHPESLGSVRLIYDAEAVFAARELIKLELEGRAPDNDSRRRMLSQELDLAKHAETIVTVSNREAQLFKGYGYSDVRVLGHSIKTEITDKPWSERTGLLFIGRLADQGSPNNESVIWFVDNVLPHVRARIPDIKLLLVGKNDAPDVQKLASESVVLAGMVPDLRSYYNDARVFIAPTRFAGGIPYKVHEAAAHGLPTVCTSLLGSQLGWQDCEELLVADRALDFAKAVVRLYADETLWTRLRKTAFERVTRECDPNQFERILIDAVVGEGYRHQNTR